MHRLTLTHGGALSNLPLFLAIDTGLFPALGLAVEAPALNGFGSTVERLRDGTASIGTTGFTQVLADADAVDPLVVVAGSGLRGMAVLGGPGTTLASLADSVIGTFADDPMQVLLTDVLESHALAGRTRVRLMPSLSAAADALMSGNVTAITTVEPWIGRLVRQGATLLSDGTDVWGPDYPDTVLVTRRGTLRSVPDIVTKVIRAMLRAETIVRHDPCHALSMVAHRFPDFTLDELETGLRGQPPRVDLRGLEHTLLQRWSTVRGMQAKPCIQPPDLVDLRCLAAAVDVEPSLCLFAHERNAHVQ